MYIKFIKFWKILFDILKLSGVPNASLTVFKSIIVFCVGALLEIITLSMIAPIAFAIITNKPLKLGVFQIDGLFANTSINKFWLFIGLFVFLTIGLISKLLCQFYITRLSAYFGSNISKRIFIDLLQAKYSYSSTVEPHKLFTTFTQKLELTVQTLALYFRILSNLIISLGIIIISIVIAGINFAIILTIAFVCLNSLIVYVIRKRTKRYSEFTKINIDFAQEQINNILGNLEIIKLRSVNSYLSQSYNTSVKNYRYSLATSDFLSTSPRIITESFLIFAILSGLLMYKLTVSIESPILLLEVLGTFLVLSQRLLPSVTQISGGINAIIARKPAVVSLLDMSNLLRENSEYDGFSTGLPLNKNSLVSVQSNSTYLQDQNNSLDINIIDLVYRDQNKMLIIDGLNAVIPHGQTTSIIGPSGSGKSTLVKLISGLLVPMEKLLIMVYLLILHRDMMMGLYGVIKLDMLLKTHSYSIVQLKKIYFLALTKK